MSSTLKLLSTGNPKTIKGQKQGYMTYILHLSPSTVSGVINTCPKATEGCKAVCLNTAGRGGMFLEGSTNTIQEARKRKTRFFASDRVGFMAQLEVDITKSITQSKKKGLVPVFRLNGTSDLSWEKYIVRDGKNIFELFPTVQFYDYTKVLGRKVADLSNYHLTFSKAENNDNDVKIAMQQGLNVAVVFNKTPTEWNGSVVFDADSTDLRFLDPVNSIIGLKAKGKARKDKSGFVVQV